MAGAQKKSLDAPDTRVRVEGIAADLVEVGDASVARNIFAPGCAHCALRRARPWPATAEPPRVVRPITPACSSRADDGSVLDVGPNDVYDIPPGHDGWVTSDTPMRAVTRSGVRAWLPQPDAGERVLTTLVVTDIVASTELAVRLGDRAWRELLSRDNAEVRDVLDASRGRRWPRPATASSPAFWTCELGPRIVAGRSAREPVMQTRSTA
jgi:hypothetical protein